MHTHHEVGGKGLSRGGWDLVDAPLGHHIATVHFGKLKVVSRFGVQQDLDQQPYR